MGDFSGYRKDTHGLRRVLTASIHWVFSLSSVSLQSVSIPSVSIVLCGIAAPDQLTAFAQIIAAEGLRQLDAIRRRQIVQ